MDKGFVPVISCSMDQLLVAIKTHVKDTWRGVVRSSFPISDWPEAPTHEQ